MRRQQDVSKHPLFGGERKGLGKGGGGGAVGEEGRERERGGRREGGRAYPNNI